MAKPLPKSILKKLSTSETRKLKSLKDKSDKLGKEMVRVQANYVIAFRRNRTNKRLPKMADKGFKCEKIAFEAADELSTYKDKLKKKYV